MKKFLIGGAILGGVGLFAYAIYRYVKTQADLISNFGYKIMDFGISQIDLQAIKGTLTVLFTSTADVEVTVKEFIVDFYLNGVKIGYIEDISEFIIPARSSSMIPFSYTLNPQVAINNLVDIISQTIQTSDETLEVNGYATLKSNFITLTLPIQYKTTLKEILSG